MTKTTRLLIIGVGVLALFIGLTIGHYNTLTRPFPGHNDFMSRWEGARSYWYDGLDPYSEQASLNIQERIYGRAAMEGEDPGLFAYPFYTVFVVWPFVHVDYSWASAAWMVLLEFCLVGALFLLLDIFRWRPSPLMLGGLIVFTLAFNFSARGLILGQPGHLVYFLEVLTFWALYRRHDAAAAIALAISTIKPQMGFLIVPFLLLWALRVKRWRFIAAFISTFGVMMAASFILLPNWFSEWLYQLGLYPTYTEIGSPTWVVGNWLWLGIDPISGKWRVMGGYGDIITFALNAVFVVVMLWGWYTVLLRNRKERFWWVVMWTLLTTHMIAPRTATPHYVVFFIAIIFYFSYMVRHHRRGAQLVVFFTVFLLVLPWLHFLLTVEGEFEHPSVYVPLPFIMAVLLWWTRRLWWGNVVLEEKA